MSKFDDDLIDFDATDDFDMKPPVKKKKNNTDSSKSPGAKRKSAEKNSKDIREPKASQIKPEKRNPLSAITVIMTIVTLIAVTLSLYLAFLYSNANKSLIEKEALLKATEIEHANDMLFSDEELNEKLTESYNQGASDKQAEIYDFIKNDAQQPGPSYSELLWRMFDDYVVYLGPNGFNFVPINESISRNNIDNSNLVVCETGEIKYCVDGVTTSKRCIDVSAYQGEIDWEQVADAGVEYAYIRAGYRGYGTGKLVEDDYADDNISGALENGISVGVYFFSQAITENEIDEEIQMMLDAIEPYDSFDGPLIIDIERVDEGSARGNQLTQSERTQLALYFCNRVRELGYEPIIYGNLNSIFNMLDSDKVATETIWFAFFYDYLYYPYELHGWQYSSSSRIPGIEGDVDQSIIFE